ncbi:hypothetical protein TGME49_204010 [Toxoplasma gondii ME49]|uniref:Uncharacterized protein n=2 Tax=Toxoplasma gondii TaxID=5811 RepID=A0A2G8XX06_TOXGO|nr:hypothetical protein TGME49_204010 [Toxoplasma gondii ME49]EPT30066.1 hypothetical protein TGME49_204010 [Toxoplasma gondii ME49]PIL99560.1 hypothetical protein TGCOUG_204010 [Toxoplasma gondii COUG]|eukprot:XP_002367683.1 hypothetical protein TGME49_204010 [Toxoplasma gondii ME49]
MGLPTNAEQVTGKTRRTMLPQNEFRQVGGGLTDSGIFLKDGTRPGRRLRMLHVWNDPTILRNKYTLGDVTPSNQKLQTILQRTEVTTMASTKGDIIFLITENEEGSRLMPTLRSSPFRLFLLSQWKTNGYRHGAENSPVFVSTTYVELPSFLSSEVSEDYQNMPYLICTPATTMCTEKAPIFSVRTFCCNAACLTQLLEAGCRNMKGLLAFHYHSRCRFG